MINIGTHENNYTYYGGCIDVCPFFFLPRNFHYAVQERRVRGKAVYVDVDSMLTSLFTTHVRKSKV